MKRLFVKWFFRFDIYKENSGRFVITFKRPFGEWFLLAGERFVLRSMAEERIREIRNDGAYLFD